MDPRVVAATVLALGFFLLAIYLAWSDKQREQDQANAAIDTDWQRLQRRADLKKLQAPGLSKDRRRL